MKKLHWVSYAETLEDVKQLAQFQADEVLLGHPLLSRLSPRRDQGTPSLSELAQYAWRLNLKPVLDWDILMTEPHWREAQTFLCTLDLRLFSAIRVQDPGAFQYLFSHPTKPKIQVHLETGHRNLASILQWSKIGQDRLEKIIVSVEIPSPILKKIIQALPHLSVEVLGLGPLLIFYTPRSLLSSGQKNSKTLSAIADSLEKPGIGLHVIENQHGTLIYHSKDYCLVEQIPLLQSMGLGAFRVDFRHLYAFQTTLVHSLLMKLGSLMRNANLSDFQGDFQENVQNFLNLYPNPHTHCFFYANRTDRLFQKLKNPRLQRQASDPFEVYLGEVSDVIQDSVHGSYLVLNLLAPTETLKKGDTLRLLNPEGYICVIIVHDLRNLELECVDQVEFGQFAVIPHVKRIPPRSVLFKIQANPSNLINGLSFEERTL